jgi:hypothetical protein
MWAAPPKRGTLRQPSRGADRLAKTARKESTAGPHDAFTSSLRCLLKGLDRDPTGGGQHTSKIPRFAGERTEPGFGTFAKLVAEIRSRIQMWSTKNDLAWIKWDLSWVSGSVKGFRTKSRRHRKDFRKWSPTPAHDIELSLTKFGSEGSKFRADFK